MYGFSISLLMDTKQVHPEVNSKIRDCTPNLIWAEYDRIHIEKISKFNEFFKLDKTVSFWTGSIQSLHLYTNEDEDVLLDINNDSGSNIQIIYDKNRPNINYPLALILSLKINESIFANDDMDFNLNIKQNILKKAKAIIGDYPIQSFFSLGEEDIVLIVLGNSIDLFMSLIQGLREMKFYFNDEVKYIFNLTNSFLIQNGTNLEEIVCNNVFANVHIALEKGINEYDFIGDFKTSLSLSSVNLINSTILVGEYDLVLHLENKDGKLFDLYNQNNTNCFLNAKNPFYKKIKKSKTIWCINENNRTQWKEDKPISIPLRAIFKPQKANINEKISKAIKIINDKKINDNNTRYVCHNVIYFLKDAAIAYNSATTEQWQYILEKQIDSFIDVFNSNNTDTYSEDYLIDLNETITDMRNSFSHINRSHEMFYHTSVSSLHYLGSFNMILMAYYNYINKLLELAYHKPHYRGTRQANITFFVYFGMTSKINSKIYLSNYANPNETKLVGFELPYAALYDLKKYFTSLTHEVYHLIAPYDREKRNKIISCRWEETYLKREFVHFVLNECTKFDVYNVISSKEDKNKAKKILGDYFDKHSKFLTDTKINFARLDYSTINKQIYNIILSERDNLKGYYINLLDDFCKECNGKDESDKILTFFAGFDTSLCKFETSINVNYKILNNFKAVTLAIKECICDTFMYQLSFRLSENGDDCYLKYLLEFFKERKIDYMSDTDATLRLGMFLDYIDFDFNKSKLETQELQQVEFVFGKYLETIKGQRNFVKQVISKDDFLCLYAKLFDKDKCNKIITAEKDINQIVHYLDNNDEFKMYISLLHELNNDFVLVKPDNNTIVNKTISNGISLKKRSVVKKNTDSSLDIIPTQYASTLDEYLKCVNFENKDGFLWYRGICNTSYKLIPSLYVNLPDKIFPYYFQNSLLRQSYDETKKNYHTFSKHEFPSAMRQSLMQHYGVPTNLLDFSTDPLASLYWALNPDNDNDKGIFAPAVVYFFNPHKYQKACNVIQNYYKCHNKDFLQYNYGIHSHNCLDSDYIINNMSDEYIAQKAKKYENDMKKYYHILLKNHRKRIIYNKMPIPIVIPQKNDRILAQSGTFVAFNLCNINIDKNGSKEGFYYLALENILKEYIDICKKSNIDYDENIFLQRIIIHAHCISSIRDTLNNTFNYSRESVYPDLENQLKCVKKIVLDNI